MKTLKQLAFLPLFFGLVLTTACTENYDNGNGYENGYENGDPPPPTIDPPTTAPTGLSVQQNDLTFRLEWDTVLGATSYRIFRSRDSVGEFTQIGETGYAYFVDAFPLIGNSFFRVSAVNDGGESPQSESVSVELFREPGSYISRINYSDWAPSGLRPDTINFDPEFGGTKFDEFNLGGHIVVKKTNPNAQLNVTDRTLQQMQTPATNKSSQEYTFRWTATPTIDIFSGHYIGDSTGTNWGLQIFMDQPEGHLIRAFFPGQLRFVPIQDDAYWHRAANRAVYNISFFKRKYRPMLRAFPESLVTIGIDAANTGFQIEQSMLDALGLGGTLDYIDQSLRSTGNFHLNARSQTNLFLRTLPERIRK